MINQTFHSRQNSLKKYPGIKFKIDRNGNVCQPKFFQGADIPAYLVDSDEVLSGKISYIADNGDGLIRSGKYKELHFTKGDFAPSFVGKGKFYVYFDFSRLLGYSTLNRN